MEFLTKWGTTEIHTLLFKKPKSLVVRVVFHNGWKTFSCLETETIGDLRKRVAEKRMPTDDDHPRCRIHEHIDKGAGEVMEGE